MTLRNTLRTATGSCHARVDALFGQFDLSSVSGYRGFLSAHARAVPALEAALREGGVCQLLDDWPARERGAHLAGDMRRMGVAPPSPLTAPRFRGTGALLGATYVLEGSRMGAAVLARAVSPELPKAYLDNLAPKGSLKAFMELLEQAPLDFAEEAGEAARSVFTLFETAARCELETQRA